MQSVSLAGFLSRATPYESWRAPLDQSLRRSALLAGPTILAGLLLTLMLPFGKSDFFLVLGDQFEQIAWSLYEVSPFLEAFNLVSLAIYLALLVVTKGLASGRPQFHWAALAEVIIGAANGLVIALELAIIVINIVLWVLIICLCIAGVAIFVDMFASSA